MPSDQKQFENSNAGASQCDAILGLLQERADWVPVYELHQVSNSLAVHSRISELRERGHVIENRRQRIVLGTRWVNASEYKWISFDPVSEPTVPPNQMEMD